MAPPSAVRAAPPPEPPPLPPTPPPAQSPGAPSAPGQVWAGLSPMERGRRRQTLAAVLREALRDAIEQ